MPDGVGLIFPRFPAETVQRGQQIGLQRRALDLRERESAQAAGLQGQQLGLQQQKIEQQTIDARFGKNIQLLNSLLAAGADDATISGFISERLAPDADGRLDNIEFGGQAKQAGNFISKAFKDFQTHKDKTRLSETLLTGLGQFPKQTKAITSALAGIETLRKAEQPIVVPGAARLATPTGEILVKPVPREPKVLSTKEKTELTTKLITTFRNDPRFKSFQTIDFSFKSMQKLATQAKTEKQFIALDQALITLFNKITDPTSVVRESEFARTPEGQGFLDQMRGFVQRVSKGGVGLTSENRDALVRAAAAMQQIAKGTADQFTESIRQLATEAGLDPQLVIGRPRQAGAPQAVGQPATTLETQEVAPVLPQAPAGQPAQQGNPVLDELRKRGVIQ